MVIKFKSGHVSYFIFPLGNYYVIPGGFRESGKGPKGLHLDPSQVVLDHLAVDGPVAGFLHLVSDFAPNAR